VLKGMTKEEYRRIQLAIRSIADEQGVPPIWFEAAWSAERKPQFRKGEHDGKNHQA